MPQFHHAPHLRPLRSPIYCILPPYMINAIAQRGTPEQKEVAEQTRATTQALLGQRIAVARGDIRPAPKVAAPTAMAPMNRFVHSAGYGSTLPGTLVRKEGDSPTGDPAADEAYDGAGATYELYLNQYGRNSIDNQGMDLVSTVHFQKGYDNAFWNGYQMVYGDGDEDLPVDQRLFNRFTISLDVIAHELTHGVTQHEANLAYYNQSGALNESVSDVFGALVKQYRMKQPARAADWLIGAGLFTSNVSGAGIRSMKAPGTAYNDPVLGKDPQPGHMSGYVQTSQDNGGVHTNSGIPNHAFYIAACEMDGFAWEKAGVVWYVTLTDKRLSSTASFQDFANLTHTIAGERFGANSLEQMAVRKGWNDVGIAVAPVVDPGPAPEPANPGCLQALVGLLSMAGKRK